MRKRPASFDEVVGHRKVKQRMLDCIQHDRFPNCSILIGPEGVGKTTLLKIAGMAIRCEDKEHAPCGKCPSCREIKETIIDNNGELPYFKTFDMSMEGGMDAAKTIMDFANSTIIEGPRIVAMEELVGMYTNAQNAMLQGLEYLPKDTYLIGATTDLSNLKPTFLRRFARWNLHKLTEKEVIDLLEEEAKDCNLRIQGGRGTLSILASWADNKPGLALKSLEIYGVNSNVTMDDIKEYVNYMDTDTLKHILKSFNGSIREGIDAIMAMNIDFNTQRSVHDLLIEVYKISEGETSLKLSYEDNRDIREIVRNYPRGLLVNFIHRVGCIQVFNNVTFLSAFLEYHPSRLYMLEHDTQEVLEDQYNFKRDLGDPNEDADVRITKSEFKSITQLMSEGSVVKGDE